MYVPTSEWLEMWRPKVGVISTGHNNHYGHPHPKVLRTMRDANVPVMRTDLDGEIQFKLTPGGLKVRTKRNRIHEGDDLSICMSDMQFQHL